MYAYVRMLPFSGSISVVQRCVTFPFHSIIFFLSELFPSLEVFYFCFLFYINNLALLYSKPTPIFSLSQRTKIQKKNIKLLRKGINFFLVFVGILPYLFCLVLPSSSSHIKKKSLTIP